MESELQIRTIAEEQEELQKLHFRIIYKRRRERKGGTNIRKKRNVHSDSNTVDTKLAKWFQFLGIIS